VAYQVAYWDQPLPSASMRRSLHYLVAEAERLEDERAGHVVHLVDALLELLEAIGPDEEWMVDAACRGQTSLFFPERGVSIAPARRLCSRCPVWLECRTWAELHPEQGGYLAGSSERERQRVRRGVDRSVA